MIMRPRRAMLIGLLFIAIGIVYGILSRDWGGVTMLLALGVAMGLMGFVLMAASPRGDETE